jgi:DNA-binding CsgD family transcriptional regulator
MLLQESIMSMSRSLLEMSQFWLGKYGSLPPAEAVARHLEGHLASILYQNTSPVMSNLHEDISQRETQVLDGIFGRLSNKEIADRLHISERTVKFHVSNLLAKFKVATRTDLLCLLCNVPNSLPGAFIAAGQPGARADRPPALPAPFAS